MYDNFYDFNIISQQLNEHDSNNEIRLISLYQINNNLFHRKSFWVWKEGLFNI